MHSLCYVGVGVILYCFVVNLTDCSKAVLLLWIICYSCLAFVMLSCLFIAALWSHDGKGLTSCLSFMMSNCEFVTFQCGILGQVWYLVVLILDLCCLSYFRAYTLLYNSEAYCYKQGVCSKLTEEGLALMAFSAAENPNLYANVCKQIDRWNSQVTVSWQEANVTM